uniref:Short-chain dehydrogenase/reductase 3 n=1 Tax=Parascaris univalens TaxID=6257 RepID=A0A915AAV5_PARUN
RGSVVKISIAERSTTISGVVLITGSACGLGRELALRFAKEGARLVLWDIDKEGNENTAEICRQFQSECHTYTIDVSRRELVYKTADEVRSEVGDVDILISNAGITNDGKFMDVSDERICRVMEVNVMANIWITRSFLPSMLSKNCGHIVAICSVAGLFGASGLVDYSVSKFAFVGFVEALRHELINLGKCGIKTTTICPFYFTSNMTSELGPLSLPPKYSLLDLKMVADRTVEAILKEADFLIIPRILYLLYFFKGMLPTKLYDWIVTRSAV